MFFSRSQFSPFDVRLEVTPGQWADLPTIGKREVDRTSLEVRVPASFAKPELRYTTSFAYSFHEEYSIPELISMLIKLFFIIFIKGYRRD